MPRVILSRKGFDSSAGGAPSPVLFDGSLVSLPIPEHGTGATYGELHAPDGTTYFDLLRQAGVSGLRSGRQRHALTPALEAHLDPDLCPTTRARPPGWRPAFGQSGAAQTILERAGVGVGDLFLFFGWFRPTADAVPVVGHRRHLHVIWGWLRVGDVVTAETAPPGLAQHPHVVAPNRPNNRIYVAADEAFDGVRGAGLLHYRSDRVLTAPDAARRADWLLPDCLHPSRATLLDRHARRFSPITSGRARFDARWQWQEFVAAGGADLQVWAETIVRGDECSPPRTKTADEV